MYPCGMGVPLRFRMRRALGRSFSRAYLLILEVGPFTFAPSS
jgi:hypothetical protein